MDPYSAAQVRNAGSLAAPDGVIVFADADTLPESREVVEAAITAARFGACAAAHDWREDLSEGETADVLATNATNPVIRRQGLRPMVGLYFGGGVFAVARERFLAMGGYDPRFVGYGAEDTTFGLAWETVYPQSLVAIPGHAFHLWHPRVGREVNPGNVALLARYQAVAGDATALRALRAEGGAL
jgi:hypothetical protein